MSYYLSECIYQSGKNPKLYSIYEAARLFGYKPQKYKEFLISKKLITDGECPTNSELIRSKCFVSSSSAYGKNLFQVKREIKMRLTEKGLIYLRNFNEQYKQELSLITK